MVYERLPNLVVGVNRGVGVAMSQRPEAGLRLLDELEDGGTLNDYYLFHAARADLLRRTGWLDESQAAYKRALALTQNGAEQSFLMRRLAEVESRMKF